MSCTIHLETIKILPIGQINLPYDVVVLAMSVISIHMSGSLATPIKKLQRIRP